VSHNAHEVVHVFRGVVFEVYQDDFLREPSGCVVAYTFVVQMRLDQLVEKSDVDLELSPLSFRVDAVAEGEEREPGVLETFAEWALDFTVLYAYN